MTVANVPWGAIVVVLGVAIWAACAPTAPAKPDQPTDAQPNGVDEIVVAEPKTSGLASSPSATPEAEPDPCAAAVELATQRFRADQPAVTPPTFAALAPHQGEKFDFNMDGKDDCVVVPGLWDERWIFIAQGASTYQFVGNIIADDLHGFSCLGRVNHGLCNLSGSQQMIHGETQTREYAFDGTLYRQVAVRLSAPHPKFGP